MGTFGHLFYRQRGKILDYVEDVKNFAKHKELVVFTNVGSQLFDWKGQTMIL